MCRRGRHFTFLARAMVEYGLGDVRGIACNEYTAVCITPDGTARVYGDHPNYDEYAYFLRANCVAPNAPEMCTSGMPLTWDRSGAAVVVYKVPGVQAGNNGINIQDWNTEVGGAWEHWSAVNGSFSAVLGAAWDRTTGLAEAGIEAIGIRYNGTTGELMISGCTAGDRVRIFDAQGRLLMASTTDPSGSTTIRCSQWGAQALVVHVDGQRGSRSSKVLLF